MYKKGSSVSVVFNDFSSSSGPKTTIVDGIIIGHARLFSHSYAVRLQLDDLQALAVAIPTTRPDKAMETVVVIRGEFNERNFLLDYGFKA